MESNNEIARVPFAVNEQDFERETDFIHTKVLSGMKTVTQVQLTVSLLLVTGLLAVTGWRRHLAIIALLLLLTVLVVAWKGISGWMLRRGSQKSAKTMRDAGEFDAPMEAVFYPDRLSITGADTHSVFPWERITDAFETADGLYLVYQRNRYLYVPARFFRQDTAFAVTSFLEQTLGKKFQREGRMTVSDTAAMPGGTAQPVTEPNQPAYQFEFVMTGKDMSAVAGRMARILLTVCGLFVTLMCVAMAWGILQRGNAVAAVVALAIFCVVIIVAFVRIYRKHIGASNYPERQVTMRWYDDHVTTVIHQADEGFHRVPYAKLRKIRRQGHLTVIAFHDNTFLYVPRTAFSDEGQQTAFEAFLKEKCA